MNTHLDKRGSDGIAGGVAHGGVVGSGEAGEDGNNGVLGEHLEGVVGLLVVGITGNERLLKVKSVGVVKRTAEDESSGVRLCCLTEVGAKDVKRGGQ